MNIKEIVGVSAGAAVLAAGEAYSLWKYHKVAKELKEFNSAVDTAMEHIDVTVPNELVAVAMDRAADKAASKAAENVTSAATAVIQNSVDKVIKDQKSSIEKSVTTELERQISLVDIEDIKSKVVSKASASVANDLMCHIPVVSSSSSSDIANIIRACKDANMSGWQIEDVLRRLKED